MKTNKYSAKAARIGTTPKHVLVKQRKAQTSQSTELQKLGDAIEAQYRRWRSEAYGHYNMVIVDELSYTATQEGKPQQEFMARPIGTPLAMGRWY